MTYRRIQIASDLPPPGQVNAATREMLAVDFKEFADGASGWEHAKDIAAFANGLGGVILVGVREHQGIVSYPGLKNQSEADVKAIYEHAAMQCSPIPVVDVVPIPLTGGAVLIAVNVDPYVDQIVAAPAGSRNKHGELMQHGTAWVFPVRSASQTAYLKPERLPMYMNPMVRRAVLLLSRMAKGSKVTLHFQRRREIQNTHWDGICNPASEELTLDDWSVERNGVTLRYADGRMENTLRLPFAAVKDVWEYENDRWALTVSGTIEIRSDNQGGRKLTYRPFV